MIRCWVEPQDNIADTLISNLHWQRADKTFGSQVIESFVEQLDPDVHAYIEAPYVDAVYRDSFYHYYSKCHAAYSRDCMRVSLFQAPLKEADFSVPESRKLIEDSFLGFFVVRPIVHPIGRVLLAPAAFGDVASESLIIYSQFKISLEGIKLAAHAFPYLYQDQQYISCSEAMIWCMVQYFGNEYPDYRTALPSEIHSHATKFAFERKLPAQGLRSVQVAAALEQLGVNVKMYTAAELGGRLQEVLYSFVESGLPVYANLSEEGGFGHVLLLIGHLQMDLSKATLKKAYSRKVGDVHVHDASQFARDYVLVDDASTPYSTAQVQRDVNLTHLDQPGKKGGYQKRTIESIIVPLKSSIRKDATSLLGHIDALIKELDLGADSKNLVTRKFLMKGSSIKHQLLGLFEASGPLVTILNQVSLPKFAWVVELASEEEFKDGLASTLAIFDATELTDTGRDRVVLIGRNISIIEDTVTVGYNRSFGLVSHNLQKPWKRKAQSDLPVREKAPPQEISG